MMRVLQVYQNGLTGSTVPKSSDHLRAKKASVQGWSASSTRSNTAFLRSIREDGLTGYGIALTLTVRDCPPTHDDWKSLRDAFFRQLSRMGMIRAHWVTEWQRRGVPHLHCAIWFQNQSAAFEASFHWFKRARKYGCSLQAQHTVPITDAIGWFKYTAKHAARGITHYQRSSENIPEGWKKTGRVWGYLGDWPKEDPMRFEISDPAFYRLRRIFKSYLIADARSQHDKNRVKHLKGMLNASIPTGALSPDQIASQKRTLSNVRGFSEWHKMDKIISLLQWMNNNGYHIEH